MDGRDGAGLAAIRVLWRKANRPPPPLESMPAWQHKIADGMHYLLYLLIFAVPISGYFYTYAAGVPVVYLGLWQMPAVIAPDPELKATLKTVHYVLTMTMAAQ
jgi:cytochrome b561